jgi:hypothetical protein
MQVLEHGPVKVCITSLHPTGSGTKVSLKAGFFKKTWTVDYATKVGWANFLRKVAKALEK